VCATFDFWIVLSDSSSHRHQVSYAVVSFLIVGIFQIDWTCHPRKERNGSSAWLEKQGQTLRSTSTRYAILRQI
jgi:hypothetical protein